MICRHHYSAFTIVEMIVVTLIIGIASALLLPSLSANNGSAGNAAARGMLANLLFAQNQAITTQQTQYVAFTLNSPAGADHYAITNSSGTTIVNPATQMPYLINFGSAASGSAATVRIASICMDGSTTITSGSATLAFDSLGIPYSVAASGVATAITSQAWIQLTNGTTALHVCIQPATGELSASPG